MTSLAQRLTRKKQSRFLVERPKISLGSQGAIDVLGVVAKETVNARMAILERQVNKAVDEAIKDIEQLVPELKDLADDEIRQHIQTRLPEIRGKDGYTPKKGVDYFDGKDGAKGEKGDVGPAGLSITGPKGENGKDGSPDSPDQVVEKVNTAEKKIAFSKIAGLAEQFEIFRKAIMEKRGGGRGGGGKGNTTHEHTAISSATTTVSTVYNIAGGGFALNCFYNGQQLARGTDYTVSGKTITLLFTPQDSTVFDVVYERT